MEYFLVRYDFRVVIYERKMFIRLATGLMVMVGDWRPTFKRLWVRIPALNTGWT